MFFYHLPFTIYHFPRSTLHSPLSTLHSPLSSFLFTALTLSKGIDALWRGSANELKLLHQYHKFMMFRQLVEPLSQERLSILQWSDDSSKFVACAQILCEWSVHQNETKADQCLDALILGELVTMCPQLKMSPPTSLSSHDFKIDKKNYWEEDQDDNLKAMAKKRENNIKQKSLLYVCMMSTEIGSSLSLKGKRRGEVANPFSAHLWRFCCSVANAPSIQWENVEKAFYSRIQSSGGGGKLNLIRKCIEKNKKEEGRKLAMDCFKQHWPCGIVYPPDVEELQKMNYPWLFLPIGMIMKQAGHKLFKRYGIQGFKMFHALQGKLSHIVAKDSVFEVHPGGKSWQNQNRWYTNMKVHYGNQNEFFRLLVGNGPDEGLFMNEHRQTRDEHDRSDEGFYAKIWSVIKDPPAKDYSKITSE